MKMVCNPCGGERTIDIGIDSRGLPFAKCSDCGRSIKKMSTIEVIAYYKEQLDYLSGSSEAGAEVSNARDRKAPCKYCTENYFMRQGRLGTIYKPVQPEYCPMCGRHLEDSDRNY